MGECLARAIALQQQGDTAAAVDAYWQALQAEPSNPAVFNNFAVLLKNLAEYALAETCLKEALRLKPDYSAAWNNLGNVYRARNDLPAAAEALQQGLALAPQDAELYLNLGNVLLEALELDGAIEAYRLGLHYQPEHVGLRWDLGLALLLAGRYREAWPYYAARLELDTADYPFDRHRQWRGEPVNEPVLLWHEQGFGDSFQMLRAMPALRAAYPGQVFALATPKSMQSLVQASLPDIPWRDLAAAPGEHTGPHLPLMSIPGVLNWEIADIPQTFPYLRAPDAALARACQCLPTTTQRRIGLVWGSGQAYRGHGDRDRLRRSIPLAALSPLFALPGLDWVSLQVGPAADELAAFPGIFPAGPHVRDWGDTAGVIGQLDLLISVDTGVAHLAAALGCPCWLLMKHDSGNFFPLTRDDTPWYPATRIFRQSQPGCWAEIIERVKLALQSI